jgi:hypothetical protein
MKVWISNAPVRPIMKSRHGAKGSMLWTIAPSIQFSSQNAHRTRTKPITDGQSGLQQQLQLIS